MGGGGIRVGLSNKTGVPSSGQNRNEWDDNTES
jgi:hypothetical protein